MNAFQQIKSTIDALNQRDFYKYVIIGTAIIVGLMAGIVFYYNHKENSLRTDFEALDENNRQVQRIIKAAQRVAKQRIEVDAMLAKDESFKLVDYLESTLKELNLSNKWTSKEPPSEIDQDNNYRETTVKVNLADIDMKQLCELLQKLDQNKRVFTKELEIIKSKMGAALDVHVTIATLEPKTRPA